MAGPIAFPRVRTNDEQLCENVVQATGVLLLPGALYQTSGQVRVGFGRRNLHEAIHACDAFLSTYDVK